MTDARQATAHERRIANMTTRERLIFRLVRRVAFLMGRGKTFDAECDRIASMTDAELEIDMRDKLKTLHDQIGIRHD